MVNTLMSYKVYAFDDGGSIWRRVYLPVTRSRYREIDAKFEVHGVNPRNPIPGEIHWLEQIQFSEDEPLEGQRGEQQMGNMNPDAAPYVSAFMASIGFEHPWFHRALPCPLEIDDGLFKAIQRADSLYDHPGRKTELANLEAIGQDLQGLNGISASVHSKYVMKVMIHHPLMELPFFIEHDITYHGGYAWAVTASIESEKKLGILEYESNKTLGEHGDNKTLGKAWSKFTQQLEKVSKLILVPASEMDAYWAKHDRPGRALFDDTAFRMLGIRSPVLLQDDEFVTWAEATGLEKKVS